MPGIPMMQHYNYDQFMTAKEDEIRTEVSTFTRAQMHPEESFDRTREAFLRKMLLNVVTIGEGEVTDEDQREIQSGGDYLNPFPGSRTRFTYTVAFPVTGSEEMFAFKGDNGNILGDRIWQPENGNLEVEVESGQLLQHSRAREIAREQLAATRRVLEINASRLTQINERLTNVIQQRMESRRNQLD